VFFYFEGTHKLQDFRKKTRKIFAPVRDEVTEQFKVLHDEELRDWCSSAYTP
jgi:hypothetical protein